MFWKFNLLSSSHVDTLLDKEDVTLRELMDEDDILQECKAQNRKLVDFLIQPEHMEEMVRLITVEPPNDVDEKLRFKYPNTACELLTTDVAQINEKLAGDEELVGKLYAFLEGPRPLNPLLASFFSKVMGLLITRKSEMIFEYLKSRNDFVERLLYHIGTSAVMDLLLRLITCIESSETRRAVIEWLNKEKIVERLVDSIVASKDEDIHCNSAQSLCDIVRLGREQFLQQQDPSDPDPLLVTMEKEETVSRLLSHMFNSDKNESVLVNGLCVIHTLLEVRRQSTELSEQLAHGETDKFTQGVSNVITAIIPRLKDFYELLLNPPKQFYSSMPTSCGCLEPPFGNTRLQVAKLITALVGANLHQVNVELATLGTIPTLLDLHFKYEWNNFLHTQVEQCLLNILTSGPVEVEGQLHHPLLNQLFSESKFIERLLSEWEGNDMQHTASNGKRRGFMGHLTKLSNSISGLLEKADSSLFKELFIGLSPDVKEKWGMFITGPLAEVNKKNAIELRGHPLASSSEDDDADFKDIPFPQDTAMQQAFSDYQLQQMTSNFIDQFGFNDEEFAEQDDKIESAFSDKISSIDAEMQASDNQPSATMFEQVCSERIQQFEDDSDEDIWLEKPITFDKTAQHVRLERLQAATARCNSSDEDSTDSGEELDSPVKILQQPAEGMDIDSAEASTDCTAMDTTYSPWEKNTTVVVPATTTSPEEGWADFSKLPLETENEDSWADFSSFGRFPSSTPQGPRSSSPVEMDTTENVKAGSYVVFPNGVNEVQDNSAESAPASRASPGTKDKHWTEIEDPSTLQPDSTSPGLAATPAAGVSHTSSVEGGQQPTSDSLPSADQTLIHAAEPDSQVSSTSSEPEPEVACSSDRQVLELDTETGPASSSDVGEPQNSGWEETCVNSSVVSCSPELADASSSSQDSQSFLAVSGLLQRVSPETTFAGNSAGELQGNGPLDSSGPPHSASEEATPSHLPMTDGDSNQQDVVEPAEPALSPAQKLENARVQAREAQELFDAAMTVVHNGPV